MVMTVIARTIWLLGVKVFLQAYSFWCATVLVDPSHEDTAFLRFTARIFLEITRIGIQYKITV